MGLLDTILGRSKRVKPNLDALFGLPSAAVGLQASLGLKPTGVGSVCVKPTEGAGFAGLREQIDELLKTDNDKYDETKDSFGYSWITRRGNPDDVSDLVTDLHAVNASLQDAGFGPALLVTVVAFSDGRSSPVGLVYLYKRGTWYPFVPVGPEQRDNTRELALKAAIGDDLPIEPDLTRWFALWGAPGL
jgi:hypothetical protein